MPKRTPRRRTVKIHPTAIIHPSAEFGEEVEIGPYCVIGEEVRIGARTCLHPHVVLQKWTNIGADCMIHSGAVLGEPPQDHKYKGEKSFLNIGERNHIREFVTIHRAAGEGAATTIGNDNLIMAYSHIGHNCQIGDNITMANMVGVSGHVMIEDKVVFGGIVGVHQYVKIGRIAMIGGYSKVVQDVPPFMMADGRPTKVYGLNIIGLRRNGVAPHARDGLKQAYKLLYRSDLNISQALELIEQEVEPGLERDYLLRFMQNIKFGFGGRQNEQPKR
ncbi:MAG: acyl-ACP--UDP-N-acetylglucosamine O-acyltransferase [Armatimonadetes bacterium]|nr:acyl-ACP--UDP-N-acetylglucosamine O-acyltransferase [Armatimonadota bacterium]